ncbi:MAG: OsmC family protein [Balneolaceae bacterium]|nr:OsmC family protein [Balneolaceae bacterium]
MNISVNWLGTDQHMEATNEEGGSIRMDGTTSIGGLEGGMSPMQLLLAGIGGCSSIDVLSILSKQKQEVEKLDVEVKADKQKVENSFSVFKTIHMHFILEGDLNPKKVERALKLSITKYCSVSKALEKSSEISYDYEIR